MTTPDEAEDTTDAAGEAGALAAASQEHDEGGDPLAPLNALTEDDES